MSVILMPCGSSQSKRRGMKNLFKKWALVGLPAILSAALHAQTTTPIKHVVVIFQENVSFDHYFGTYPVAANNDPSEPAFTAAANTPSINGLTGTILTQNPNSAPPVRLTRAQAVTCDQNHNYGS